MGGTRFVTFLLAGLLLLGAARAEPASRETVAALADAEARRNRALARIDDALANVGDDERAALDRRLATDLREALRPIRTSLDAAEAEIDATIGFRDAFAAERREAKFQDALVRAGLAAAVEGLPARLQARLAATASGVYESGAARLNRILREEIADPLGPRGGAILLADLTERLRREATARLGAVENIAPGAPAELALAPLGLGAAGILTRRLIVAGLDSRLAGGLVGQALGRAATLFALSPGKATGVGILLDGGIAAASVVGFLLETGSATRSALHRRLDGWFATQVEAPLLEPGNLRTLADGLEAGVQEQLRRDRDAAARLIERGYAGMLEQVRSPGFATFAAAADEATLRRALFLVPAVFGAELVEIDYAQKVELALRIAAADTARRLVQRHGARFVALFGQYPQDVAAVANASDAEPAFAWIMALATPDAELRWFGRAIDRLGALDGPRTAALLLVRRLAPTLPAEQVRVDGLQRLAEVAGPLGAQPAVLAAPVIAGVLDGTVSARLLAEVLDKAETPALLALLGTLGPERFQALLAVARPAQLGAYLRAIPGAPRILAEDGAGSLRFWLLPNGGGVRAVLARDQVRQGNGGAIDAPADAGLRWLLARTGLAAEAIDLGLVRNLAALGIPGPIWPDALAVPAATMLARTGLVLPLLLMALLVVAPLLGWWTRLFRARLAPAALALVPARRGPLALLSRSLPPR